MLLLFSCYVVALPLAWGSSLFGGGSTLVVLGGLLSSFDVQVPLRVVFRGSSSCGVWLAPLELCGFFLSNFGGGFLSGRDA